jgi:hypothetical protein
MRPQDHFGPAKSFLPSFSIRERIASAIIAKKTGRSIWIWS